MTWTDLHSTAEGIKICSTEQVSAGADWLSLTLPADAENAYLWHVGNVGIIRTIAQSGFPLENRSLLGFTGVGAGGSFAGIGTDRYMLILSGERAAQHFDAVFRGDANVPRLDLQSTVRYDHLPDDIAHRSYYDASNHNNRQPEHKQRKLYMVLGSDGGHTFYLGRPKAEARGRIYNKEKQSKDVNFDRSWRYEITFRNDAAKRLAAIIAAQNGGRAAYIARYVRSWYAERGVTCAYDPGGDERILEPTKKAKTSVRRKLEWLHNQVAPSVRWLLEEGYRDEVLSALNLSQDD